jgi:hypothetical protein
VCPTTSTPVKEGGASLHCGNVTGGVILTKNVLIRIIRTVFSKVRTGRFSKGTFAAVPDLTGKVDELPDLTTVIRNDFS